MRTPTESFACQDETGELCRESIRRAIVSLFMLSNAAALMSGCSERQQVASKVDATVAMSALKTVLEIWKKGEKPESAKNGSPPIVVQDLDWSGGMALSSYEIQGEGKFDDANLRVPVTLNLKQPNGKSLTRKASYVVGTSPAVTVFREMP